MCQLCAISNRTEQFAQQFVGWMNGGAMMLMISIGHRTGLFDRMATLGPSTSEQLAQAAGLSERYVREWLNALTVGKVVEYNVSDRSYTLPQEHAGLLTRAASPNNLGVAAQWHAVLGSVESHIVDAFKHGCGVPYDTYGTRFHDVMAEESNQTTVAGLDEHILPLIPGLVEKLERGIDVLDIGCGKGLALIHLAARFPKSRFVGADLSPEAIAMGRREAQARGVSNVSLFACDVTRFGGDGEFDVVTAFDAVHDQARPAAVLSNIRRTLKAGGTFLMQDIKAHTCVTDNLDGMLAPFTYTISCMHCMSVSLASGGPGLGAAWGKELALQMLGEAGFKKVDVHELPHDIINYYYVMGK